MPPHPAWPSPKSFCQNRFHAPVLLALLALTAPHAAAQAPTLPRTRPLLSRLPAPELPAHPARPAPSVLDLQEPLPPDHHPSPPREEVIPTPDQSATPDLQPPSDTADGYLLPGSLQTATVSAANQTFDGQRWLTDFTPRIDQTPNRTPPVQFEQLPADFRPWWDQPVRQPSRTALSVSIRELIQGALQFSSYVKVIATEPRIRRTAVVEEDAAFDWRSFLETTYEDVSDPVGNLLTTGNNDDRFKDRTWSADAGIRRRNRLGGDLELSQQLGTQRNNSQFLLPNPQATTQLELRYTQPLLNGAGQAYNESRMVLAQIDADATSDALVQQLQEHLIQVTEAYWDLYAARAEFFQRLRLLEAAESTLDTLVARQRVDAVQRQVLRARAAVASRKSEIARAHTSIRNAESRLRLLVNDPVLVNAGSQEFAPAEPPLMAPLPCSMEESLYDALQNRPDISQAIRDIRAASVRLGVAQNEVLPKLDLVTSTYVAGLADRSDVGQSLLREFDAGRPSFAVGFAFETPFGNRAARAQEERRQWEMQRAFAQFRLTVEEALTDVEVAVREVHTNYREVVGKYHAMVAVTDEADYLFDRWRNLPGMDDSAVLLLEDLLDAQERVAIAESELVRAATGYAVSIMRLKQEMGTLLIATPCGGGS